jgi:hypothetical protein
MKRRPTLARAIGQLICLWLVSTAALAALFCVYAAATDEPVLVHPTSFRKTT